MQHPGIQFYQGSLVRLASGKLKQVQDLTSRDFLESAQLIRSRSDLSVVKDLLEVNNRNKNSNFNTVLIQFSIESSRREAFIEVDTERPFFVLERGWSSWNPSRTYEKYGLKCRKLEIGDTCMSLIGNCSSDRNNDTDLTQIVAPVAETRYKEGNDHWS